MSSMTKDEINTDLCDECKKLREENRKLRLGIKAVRDLINESSGVVGLHLNGDIAAWPDLEKGGRFEEWLADFNNAEGV